MERRGRFGAQLLVLAVVLATVVLLLLPATGGAARSVQGFDGTTLKVAGFANVQNFPNGATGAQARMKRFNDTNEIKGVKLQYLETADDKNNDVPTSLSEARRLVTQDQVFAIVPDLSAQAAAYFQAQKIPYFGWAFAPEYCSKTAKPDTTLYGFGFDGCLTPINPKVIPLSSKNFYDYVAQQTGKKHPTLMPFGSDQTSSVAAVKNNSVMLQQAGFKVVAGGAGLLPQTPVGDYSPYVQKMMTADNGGQPDAIICYLSVDCLRVWIPLSAAGYKGYYQHYLYTDSLVKPLAGSYASVAFLPLSTTGNKALDQMKADVEAFKPGSPLDSGAVTAYQATDMFIQALKTAAKKGKSNITQAAIQKIAMNQTWELKGFGGPTHYPEATVKSTDSCSAIVKSNGTGWDTVAPYSCNDVAVKVGK
jgi:hypothetical protein